MDQQKSFKTKYNLNRLSSVLECSVAVSNNEQMMEAARPTKEMHFKSTIFRGKKGLPWYIKSSIH